MEKTSHKLETDSSINLGDELRVLPRLLVGDDLSK